MHKVTFVTLIGRVWTMVTQQHQLQSKNKLKINSLKNHKVKYYLNVSWNLEINKSSKHWKQTKEYSSDVYSMYLNMPN